MDIWYPSDLKNLVKNIKKYLTLKVVPLPAYHSVRLATYDKVKLILLMLKSNTSALLSDWLNQVVPVLVYLIKIVPSSDCEDNFVLSLAQLCLCET